MTFAYRAPVRGGASRMRRTMQSPMPLPAPGSFFGAAEDILRIKNELEQIKSTIQNEAQQHEARREAEHRTKLAALDEVIHIGKRRITSLVIPAKGEKGEPAPAVDEDALAQRVLERVKPPKDGETPDKYEIAREVMAMIGIPNDGKDADENSVIQKLLAHLTDGKTIQVKHITGLNKMLDDVRRGGYHGGGITRLTAGSNITITKLSDGSYRITSTGGGGSGFQVPISGVIDGNNKTFIWATAPNVIVVDQGRAMQKTSSDLTVNWTGTTTTILAIAPISDIYATA